MSEQSVRAAIHAARITALAAELQLIAAQAQDQVMRYGGWVSDWESEFEEVRAGLDKAIRQADAIHGRDTDKEATAYLQAAAPELYEALEALAGETALWATPEVRRQAETALGQARRDPTTTRGENQ